MIEEKDINRLVERDEALKRGFELILVNVDGWSIQERILLGQCSFVVGLSSSDFLEGKAYDYTDLRYVKTIDWFDIQPLKMRKMNLVEVHDYLVKEKKMLCWKSGNDMEINTSMEFDDLENHYEKYGTLNSDGTFKPLPLTEDK